MKSSPTSSLHLAAAIEAGHPFVEHGARLFTTATGGARVAVHLNPGRGTLAEPLEERLEA